MKTAPLPLLFAFALLGCDAKPRTTSADTQKVIPEKKEPKPAPVAKVVERSPKAKADPPKPSAPPALKMLPEEKPPCERPVTLSGDDVEQRYIGLEGYVLGEPKKARDRIPKPPWFMHPLARKTRDVFDASVEKVEHKTKVKVLETALKHGGHGFHSGHLKVVETEGDSPREFWIHTKSFTLLPYWECGLASIPYGSTYVLAKVTKEMSGPDRGASSAVTVKPGEQVLCKSDQRDVEGDTLCMVYRKYRYGFGGVEHGLQSSGLEVLY